MNPLTRSSAPGRRGGEGSLSPLAFTAAVLGAATAIGLLESSQVQYDRAVWGDPISWPHALIHGLPRWYVWALLVPAVLLLTRWVHRRGFGPVRTVLVHIGLGVVISVVQVALFAMVTKLLHGGPDPLGHFRPALLKYTGLTFLGNVVTYGLLVGGWYGVQLYHRYRKRETDAARLELQTSELKAQLAHSQLQRLQAQLEPHFLFNSLHTLSALMLQGDGTGAIRMVRRLSDLLRRALRAGEKMEHPLREELNLVREYLEIQQMRFEDRMDVRIEMEEGVAHAFVPALLLQPLAENAVHHGIEADPGARRVGIHAGMDDAGERLRITIRNDGPGFADSNRAGGGLGLENSRARLMAMYGEAARLDIRDAGGGGVEVEIVLPLRSRPAATVAEGDVEGVT